MPYANLMQSVCHFVRPVATDCPPLLHLFYCFFFLSLVLLLPFSLASSKYTSITYISHFSKYIFVLTFLSLPPHSSLCLVIKMALLNLHKANGKHRSERSCCSKGRWGGEDRGVANVCAFVSSQYVQICQTNEIATGPHHSAALRPGSILHKLHKFN